LNFELFYLTPFLRIKTVHGGNHERLPLRSRVANKNAFYGLVVAAGDSFFIASPFSDFIAPLLSDFIASPFSDFMAPLLSDFIASPFSDFIALLDPSGEALEVLADGEELAAGESLADGEELAAGESLVAGEALGEV
jgi:hypothetical protein